MPFGFTFRRNKKNNKNTTNNNKNNNKPPLKRQNASRNVLQPLKELNMAFFDAAYRGKLYKVKELLAKGADIEYTKYGKTALMFVSTYGDKQMAELLLDKGANPNTKVEDDYTSLIGASSGGNKEIVELLLKKGADVNAKNKYGETSLMRATYKGYPKVVELLLENGADMDLKDNDGRTAIDFAKEMNDKQIIELFSPQMNLSKYPDGGTKKFSEGEENAISYEEFKKGDKVVVITKNKHEFMYLLDSLQAAWNAKGHPYNPSSNEALKKSDEKHIKRHTLA